MNLPQRHHPGDAGWIRDKLAEITSARGIRVAEAIASKYSAVYAETYENTDIGHTKDNKARQEANKRLRLFVDSLYSQGVKPPTSK